MRYYSEAMNMTKKLSFAIGSLILFSGSLALQGCFDSGTGYGPGYYGSGPAYYSAPGYYSQPVYGGDYDENRTWHDRDWWVNNRRDWVEDHHRDWIAHEQDMNHDARAIRQGQANIQHDRQEMRQDVRHGNYDAAAHERAEIQQRRENVRARAADLNYDESNRR
jgi:hypothetical protein